MNRSTKTVSILALLMILIAVTVAIAAGFILQDGILEAKDSKTYFGSFVNAYFMLIVPAFFITIYTGIKVMGEKDISGFIPVLNAVSFISAAASLAYIFLSDKRFAGLINMTDHTVSFTKVMAVPAFTTAVAALLILVDIFLLKKESAR